MEKIMNRLSTKKLIMTALLMALTMIATMFIRIPLALGYVNLGDAFVLISVFLLGPLWGTIAGGVGSGLADVFGYITYAPGTLVIKSVMAILAYLVGKGLLKITKNNLFSEIVAGIVGAVVMAFGYFFYEMAFFATAGVAIANVPWNLLQGGVGVAIFVVAMRVLSTTKLIDKLKE
jgi:uncharacterized membrane protein